MTSHLAAALLVLALGPPWAASHQRLMDGATTRCTDCHDDLWPAGATLHAPFSEGNCKSCHRPPFAGRIRLRSRGEKLCVSCHGDLAFDRGDAGSKMVHAAMRGERGQAGCLSCHDPHMSRHRKLLVEAGNELCNLCHRPVVSAATADTGHAAAAENCLGCHRPHVAAERPLLNGPVRGLCVRCHDTADQEVANRHLGADLVALACVSCHDPHGSRHDKLLARHLHGALEAGCGSCHDGAADRFLLPGSELCLKCHDDVGEAAAAAVVPHAAMAAGVCTQCHNPHASAQKSLIKLPAGGTCAECHDQQAAGDGEVAHGVIALIGCRACHQPHGGSRPLLLRREGPELCLSCHERKRLDIDWKAAAVGLLGFEVPVAKVAKMATVPLSADGEHGHPVDNHRVLGTPTEEELRITDTTYRGELSCLTCHNPHKGRSRQLLNWGAASALEACTECHPK